MEHFHGRSLWMLSPERIASQCDLLVRRDAEMEICHPAATMDLDSGLLMS